LVFAEGEHAESLDAQRYTPFGINFLYAYGCDTISQQPIEQPRKPFPFKYNAWEKNVSTDGIFRGVWGCVGGYQIWSHVVETPGTNSR
jgi:hypothetical protein